MVGERVPLRNGNARAALRRLRASRRGAALPIMAAAMLPMIAAIGSAVDLARIHLVRAQMQAGVDAAALAGARSFGNQSDGDMGRDRQVEIYFRQNFPLDYMGAGTVEPQPRFEVQGGINVTNVAATVDLPMTFMRVFGHRTRHIAVTARAELQPRPLEVMVVLDNTGSMQTRDVGGGSRMDVLKTAMHSFIDILHQGASQRDELAMGFVTYNVSTNVGKILADHGVAIAEVDGFTNIRDYTGPSTSNGRDNPLGWQGCVANDQSVVDLSTAPGTYETGAWDVARSLPGESVDGVTHPAVRPYHYPPNAILKTSGHTYSTAARLPADYFPAHLQSNTSDGRTNNFYLLSPGNDLTIGQALANSPAYRQHFYDYYIGLNANRTSDTDDVIVRASDGGYYTPGSAQAWQVNYSRIPFRTDTTAWAQPNARYGYPINAPGRQNHTLRMPSPNWQCPEPSMAIDYGRTKQAYTDYIDQQNFPVMPASGTLHHIGMLWGYRLLSRSDRFTRVNPIPSEEPLRALIFMTDGETAVSGNANWFSAYGFLKEKRISSGTGTSGFQQQVMRRFAKVCNRAVQEGINVYIVSLKASVPEFQTCAGSRYFQTQDGNTIRQAFDQIAVDLVELHLTQ